MAALHHHTLRTWNPSSRVRPACNGTLVALPTARNNVGIWSRQDLTSKPLELVGHRQAITAISFSQRNVPVLVCTAADDYVIVWNVEKVRNATEAGHQVRGQVVGTSVGRVQHCAFSCDDQRLAVCVDREVLILDTKEERLDMTLEGHTSRVNCAEFCPHYTSTLVSASEDRTFKVWDLSEGSLVYQSSIISSAPFVSLTMDLLQQSFALGSTDGQVRVYDLTDGNGFRCLHHLNVSKMLTKLRDNKGSSAKEEAPTPRGPVTVSSRPAWQRTDLVKSASLDDLDQEDEIELDVAILDLMYTYPMSVGRVRTPTPAKLTFLQQDESIVSDLLGNVPMLVVATTAVVLQVNARTLEPCSLVSLQEPVPSVDILAECGKTLSLAGSAVLKQSVDADEVWCILGSLFGTDISVLSLAPPTQIDMHELKMRLAMSNLSVNQPASPMVESCGQLGDDVTITVLSSAPLETNSPLKAELILKQPPPKNKTPAGRRRMLAGASPSRRASDSSVTDQPLVFHDKVKSSGYTARPRTNMFQPKTNAATKDSGKKTAVPPSPSKPVVRQYPMDSEAPTTLHAKLDVAERPTAINCARFSEDGQNLACALVNTSAQVFKMPLSGKGLAFTGHNSNVTSVGWSHDSKWILTSCDDRTANLWSLGIPDPVMTFSTVNDNFGVDREGGLKPSKENPAFAKPVRFAQFYYMDKFIMLTCGNAFYLYKFHMDSAKSDIRRYLTNNRYKLVRSLQLQQAQQITAFSAINGFYSYIVLCAGSNKTLEVFDMNVGRSLRTMVDVHTKPTHIICQNQGSPYVSHPPSAYDLFVTSAAGDCIKLWDLRSNRCVHRYDGHANRVYPCGVAISPCSRFIATGSEDRCAYIFDIRSGTYVHKLTGHTDTVCDVAYHPLYAQLLTATVDGKLRLFTDK